MKNLLLSLTVFALLTSCGGDASDPELRDPAEVHPPEQAIPDSTTIVNDSAIMPDNATGLDSANKR